MRRVFLVYLRECRLFALLSNFLIELDLSSDEAVVSSIKGGTPLREDEPHLSNVVDEILKHAPSREGHFFAVPKIIE